ncbi:MAG: triple tyrosine motif-containing protein [Acidobacteriota bacterium]
MSANSVTSLYQDADGIFWIGTVSGGLNRWDRERGAFRHYRVQDGLPSDDIVGIAGDDRERLWLATRLGLARLDPRTDQIRRYDVDDGIHGNIFFIGPAYRTRDGELLFGGNGGVTAFFPHHIEDDPNPPEVAITDFQILNRSTRLAERLAPGSVAGDPTTPPHLVLDHRDDIFAFEFAALHFAAPDKNRYAYRLEGLQSEWVETDAQRRFAQYTNLDAGDYVFRVKASNRDGIWNQEGTSLHLAVLPPPWRTWWAYGLYLLALATAVATYLRGQRNKVERERQIAARERAANQRLRQADKLKDELLANTSHELRTPLYGIRSSARSWSTSSRFGAIDCARRSTGPKLSPASSSGFQTWCYSTS